ncbi:urease accessory protein UreD [Nocardia harenae]|uniref:urease accessory protein UreD n=1 Tax=Nocardia harenae TaxID=358707 RepID=UPI0008309140|nr:urease accessory protein UreD [Nocardia harenae]
MRTVLRVLAAPGVSPRIEAVGGIAGRQTGPDTVHLIGTAATPLGGDHLELSVEVLPGARLLLRSVAAMIALPARGTPDSSAHWRLTVGAGAELDLDTEPTIVAGGARHRVVTELRLAPDAVVRVRERVRIGRAGEDHGHWTGGLIADIEGAESIPLLRHRLELGSGSGADDALSAPRTLESVLRYPDDRPAETIGLTAARLPLAAGGSLWTEVGKVRSSRTEESRPGAAAVAGA